MYAKRIFLFVPILVSFILLVSIFIFQDVGHLLRYDKYDLYFSLNRFLLLLFVLLFTVFVLKYVSGSLFKVLYPNNLFVILFLMLILPGVALTSDFSDVGFISFYSYLGSFTLFLLGMLLAKMLLGNTHKLASVSNHAAVFYSRRSITFLLMVCIFVFGFSLSIYKFDFYGSIFYSLIQYFSSGVIDRSIADSRQVAPTRDFIDLLYSYSTLLLMPLSCAFFWANGLIRRSRVMIIISLGLSVIVFLLIISEGGRLRGLFFVLYMTIVYSMVRGLKILSIINWGLLLVWLLIFQTIALGRFSSAADGQSMGAVIILSLNRVVERVLLTKGAVTQKVFEYIPAHADFKQGSTFFNALVGSASNEVSFAQEMFAYIYQGGFNGTAGPQAFGEMYANFGVVFMLFGALFLGILIQCCTEFVKKSIKMDPFLISVIAFGTILIARIGYSNLLTFKTNGMHILVLITLIFIVMRVFAKIQKKHSS